MRQRVLAALKVPPEPHPPLGDPASLRVFRAGRNYFRQRVAAWGVAQVLALAGIIFWAAVLIDVEHQSRDRGQTSAPSQPLPSTAPGTEGPSPTTAPETRTATVTPAKERWQIRLERRLKTAAATAEVELKKGKRNNIGVGWNGFKGFLVEIALMLPGWAFPLIWAVKILSFTIYLLQIPITYAVRRLDYEMHWYMVTDRSLRLRHGIWKVSESTMSFANIQQVSVSQGPLQRVLGLADVKVNSAGGGTGQGTKLEADDMHTGLFHSVTNASEIRDLILERLRRYRATGLGDPDDASHTNAPALSPVAHAADPTLAAAQELLSEAKALHAVLR
ncbi:MAG: PH domain-containing protein [Opitutus sp.]